MPWIVNAQVVLKATNVDGVFDSDPKKNSDASLLDHVSYKEVISQGLSVMDITAITLCQENCIPGKSLNPLFILEVCKILLLMHALFWSFVFCNISFFTTNFVSFELLILLLVFYIFEFFIMNFVYVNISCILVFFSVLYNLQKFCIVEILIHFWVSYTLLTYIFEFPILWYFLYF